jgi:tetratricopeptide (TPR) repeat protein
VYQEALDTYRQLAKANPQAYLPNVAATLNNLAVLYRATQRLHESEQAFQEALDTYRQLATANPQVYLPGVAGMLNNLAVLAFTQNHLQQAQMLVSEALAIRRGLYAKHPIAFGDALAQSLAVEVMLLLRTEKEAFLVCGRLQEMRNVAVSEGLKQWVYARANGRCDTAEDDKTIGKQ